MRPGNLSRSTESQLWRSPTPWVFGSIVSVMGLIAIVLIILACSHWKSSDGNNNNSASQIDNKPVVLDSAETELKVMVVIMAGDDKPSCLAKPSGVLNSSISMAPSQSSEYPVSKLCRQPRVGREPSSD